MSEEDMKPQKKFGRFLVGKLLGEGQYGKVRVGHDPLTGETVALKFLDKSHINSAKKMEYITREISIQKTLKNPHVVPLTDVIETPEYYILVLEFCEGGDLMEFLMKNGPMKEEKAVDIFAQIVRGVAYLHSEMIIHRDLKPDNILLDKTHKKVKIHDFGQSRAVTKGQLLVSSVGTPQYCCPEVLLMNKSKSGYIGSAADVWSLGVILYTMCFGHFPWVGDTLPEQLENAIRANWYRPEKLDPTLEHLLKRMLCVKPQERATIAEVMMHPYLHRKLRIDVADWPSFLPLNPQSTVDKETVDKMVALGFGDEQVRNIVLRSGPTTSQAYILYYSLLGKNMEHQKASRSRSFSAVDTMKAPKEELPKRRGLLKKFSKSFLRGSKEKVTAVEPQSQEP